MKKQTRFPLMSSFYTLACLKILSYFHWKTIIQKGWRNLPLCSARDFRLNLNFPNFELMKEEGEGELWKSPSLFSIKILDSPTSCFGFKIFIFGSLLRMMCRRLTAADGFSTLLKSLVATFFIVLSWSLRSVGLSGDASIVIFLFL